MIFYLGTHQPHWLGRVEVPLFISARRLRCLKRLPRALAPWALDSGGFTELSKFGAWETPPEQYVQEARRYQQEIGNLQWCAIQDWMCEPFMLEQTGLSLAEHQRRTVGSYRTLLDLAPDLPWVPVLQGWQRDDYLRCLDLYQAAGFDLRSLPLVGLGSVCRRQATGEAECLIRELAGLGLRLHGFGFKTGGLLRTADVLASSDSMAWSYAARRGKPLADCQHDNCANCQRYALRWRSRLLRRLEGPRQLALPLWG